jgi:hypothetical protein
VLFDSAKCDYIQNLSFLVLSDFRALEIFHANTMVLNLFESNKHCE